MPPVMALEAAFVIQLISNYRKRKAIAAAKGEEGSSSFLGATGLTTVFNALT